MQQHLSDEEKARVAALLDHFEDALRRRYGLSMTDLAEAAQFAKEHNEFVKRLKHSTWLSLIGIVIGGALLAMWEGAKALITRGGHQ